MVDCLRGAILARTRLAIQRTSCLGCVSNLLTCGVARLAAGLKKLGLQRSDNMVLDGVMTTKDGENATRKLLHESFPPTAILYATDVAALGAYKVASDLGLQIGKELSIISYDGVPEGAFANPPLTTFKIDTKKAGEQLAALLIKRVNGEAVELLRETDPAILYPGESDGSPTVSSKELSCLLEEAKIVKT